MITTKKTVEVMARTKASAREVIRAFVNEEDLKKWWGVERCLIEKQAGGVYTLAWEIGDQGFGYVSSGFIHDYDPEEYLRIDNMVYLNPSKDILGPMTLEVFADEFMDGTRIRIIQSGYQEGGDWDWYYEAVKEAWPMVLEALKSYLERIR